MMFLYNMLVSTFHTYLLCTRTLATCNEDTQMQYVGYQKITKTSLEFRSTKIYYDSIGKKSVAYIHYKQLQQASLIQALYKEGQENNVTSFNGEVYKQLPFDM